ncbi:MAG TPA: hypothetical protein VGD69_24040 [Herpetosiphonaceae bacterium]
MTDWTPFPGISVPPEQAQTIQSEWLARYRRRIEGKHPQIPTWCTFPEDVPSRNDDGSIWQNSAFQAHPVVYFYSEYGPPPNLFRATPQQVQDYFERRNPWEDRDYYIFNPEYTWCIAVTHDDIIIVIGEIA